MPMHLLSCATRLGAFTGCLVASLAASAQIQQAPAGPWNGPAPPCLQ